MTQEKDKLLGTNYDGIREYDNQLPRWWVWLFILTIVYGVIYVVYQHGFAPGQDEQLTAALQELKSKQAQAEAALPKMEISEQSLKDLAANSSRVEAGKASYLSKCAPCHGQLGEGIVGPNLTDDYWVHGGSLMAIRKVIAEGVLDKGMVAWSGLLSPDELNDVAAFVWTLRGTNPPNPKAAQGELVSR